MKKLSIDLLAMDTLAQRYGCGLNPALRAALEADVRFPSHAATPTLRAEDMPARLPSNTYRLDDYTRPPKRKHA